MQSSIDFFVSYSYRTSRKKEVRDDAYIGMMVADGYEAPSGLSRGMIEQLRGYLSRQHQVAPGHIRIINIVRLEPEGVYVPDRGEVDSDVRHGVVPQDTGGVLFEPPSTPGRESSDQEDQGGE